MTSPQTTTYSETAWFASGAFALTLFALLLAGALIGVTAVQPQPLVLVLFFLSAALSLGAGGIGAWMAYRHQLRLGRAATVITLIHLLVMLPVGGRFGFQKFKAYRLEQRNEQGLYLLSQLRMQALSLRHELPSRRFLDIDTGWAPSARPTHQRYTFDARLWIASPWEPLDFIPSTAHFHQFRYRALEHGQGFVVQARGDIDGDGQLVTHTSTVWLRSNGQIESEGPVAWPADAR